MSSSSLVFEFEDCFLGFPKSIKSLKTKAPFKSYDCQIISRHPFIKDVLGLKFYSRTKALHNELGIDLINQINARNKLFGLNVLAKTKFKAKY